VRLPLLDINLLVALAWPTHIHHEAAHRWFAAERRRGWATCPLSQSGFVRVLSTPRFSPDALTPAEAFDVLSKVVHMEGHVFWPDDTALAGSRFLSPAKLLGPRQVTDAHLLAITLRHGGRLATFDRGVTSLIPVGFPAETVQLLAA